MKQQIFDLRKEFDFIYDEIDIESDRTSFEKYHEKIPVLLIDGKLFAKYRLNESRLRKKLTPPLL